jgi:endo-1,4-beta-xylanase
MIATFARSVCVLAAVVTLSTTATSPLAAPAPASKTVPVAGALASYQNVPLWEKGRVPLATGNGPLDNPFLTVFLPPPGKANGASVIVAPGGGNVMLMYGGEGMDVAERYNEWGVTAFVLTYRLNPYGENARVADGARAVRVVRAHAAEWQLDPNRIGYVGFSAGSMMGRSFVAQATPGDAEAADPVERVSSRPDYLGLIYGPGRATAGEQLKNFPPTFLLSAAADATMSNGNAQLFLDMNKAGATVEMHIYQKGRHGFGASYKSPEFGEWMSTLRHFLVLGKFLPEDK